jgi:hypothetical protein
MRMLTFAAGVAAGCLFGTRAGRERIAAGVRNVADQPELRQVRSRLRQLAVAGADATARRLDAAIQRLDASPVINSEVRALDAAPATAVAAVDVDSAPPPRKAAPRARTTAQGATRTRTPRT